MTIQNLNQNLINLDYPKVATNLTFIILKILYYDHALVKMIEINLVSGCFFEVTKIIIFNNSFIL